MTWREWMKDRYYELKELGLCGECGLFPVEHWETLCPTCKDKRKAYWHWWKVIRPALKHGSRPLRGNMSEDRAKLGSK